jgi:hypothetical protein
MQTKVAHQATCGILRKSAICAVFLIGMTGALAQEFVPFEGKNTVREGDGGAKRTVEGVDFWSDGAPPRKFKLVGYITDRRQKTGLIGIARMAGLEKDVAELAKKNGGDAVILMASETETVGSVGMASGTARSFGNTTTASGFGFAGGVQKNNSKYAVLKYVSDAEMQPATPPAASAPAVVPSPATATVAPASPKAEESQVAPAGGPAFSGEAKAQ